MEHSYLRHCFRLSDAKHFQERCTISGESVAMQTGKSGNRADFLELLNKWNRQGFNIEAGYLYLYFARESK